MRFNKHLNPLTLFGLFSVIAMVICYALEERSPAFILAFAASCLLASIYGSGIAVNRWRARRAAN